MTNVIVLQEHTPGTPHHSGTPLENSGTPWGVRYIRLTSTDLNYLATQSGRSRGPNLCRQSRPTICRPLL